MELIPRLISPGHEHCEDQAGQGRTFPVHRQRGTASAGGGCRFFNDLGTSKAFSASLETMTTKTALVTGASSGIGESTARKLQSLGFAVYGAARRVDRLEKLAKDGIRPMAMDVTDDQSMQDGIARIVEETGRIDVLVNNAGYGSYGALEDVDIEEGRRQFEVNVFGAIRLAQLALPHMRAQRSGSIVNITSMGGKIYTPLGGWYHGTKFALEALSDCLRI